MRYGDDGAFVLPQVGLKPLYALSVKVVGGLVKEQYIRLLEKKTAKSDPPSFSSGKG